MASSDESESESNITSDKNADSEQVDRSGNKSNDSDSDIEVPKRNEDPKSEDSDSDIELPKRNQNADADEDEDEDKDQQKVKDDDEVSDNRAHDSSEEESDIELPSRKKNSKEKNKRRGNDDDDSDDDDDDDDDDEGNEDEDEGRKEPDEEDESDRDQVDEEDSDRDQPRHNDTIYDFDIMMAKKKEENSRKRKRRNYDIINDNDDIIDSILNEMRAAVEADNEANKNKQAATKKLKLLPYIVNQLRKVDLRDAFLDSDVLYVISEWLNPLPDRSLPHLQIREHLLKILLDLNLNDVDRIKASGIGKSIMYLFKHPKETKDNKQRAKELISLWSRPIFQLETNFSSISREEREKRDLDLQAKQEKRMKVRPSGAGGSSSQANESSTGKKGLDPTELPAAKPGDKGWIPRARVPAPSMKDYVIRPESRVELDIGKKQKSTNMLDKYFRSQQERRRASKQQRAVNMKIDRC